MTLLYMPLTVFMHHKPNFRFLLGLLAVIISIVSLFCCLYTFAESISNFKYLFSLQLLSPASSADAATPSNGLVRPDLTLLKPLWVLLNKMDGQQSSDSAVKCLPAVHRALTELFLMAEQQAQVQ